MGFFLKPFGRTAVHKREETSGRWAMDDGQGQGFVTQPAVREFAKPLLIHLTRKAVIRDGLQFRRNGFRDLVHVVGIFRSKLRNDPGKESRDLVEVSVIGRVAVDPIKADALKQLIHACAHRLVINQTDIGQHMREACLARVPTGRLRPCIQNLVAGYIRVHSCRRHALAGFGWEGFLAALSSSRR